MAETLTLLVIADPHYLPCAGRECTPLEKAAGRGLEWVQRAGKEALRLGRPDAVVLGGDIIGDGTASDAERNSSELSAATKELGLPVVVVPGNHDGDAERLLRVFGDHVGAHRIKGYVLYSFADAYAPGDVCTRPREAIERFIREAPDAPVVAIQHNPIYPPLDCSEYPYMPSNADEIIASYERIGVVLSLSGHYHLGQPLTERNGVKYLTTPSILEQPFPFHLVKIRGREVEAQRVELKLPDELPLVDGHVHTHFGYCAVDVHPVPVGERAEALGLKGVVCLEHAGQLYLSPGDFWERRHVDDPDALRRAREAGVDRIAAYRDAMFGFRSGLMRVGLEVECDRDGKVNLLEEDRHGWDVLVGAVHWLPSHLPASTPEECSRSFFQVVEHLLDGGIDRLAHPWRFLSRQDVRPTRDLYRTLARLLADRGVAVEVNCHNNVPDPEFFGICAEAGVPIVLGSDAHCLRQVADLQPHVRLLRQIGFPLSDVLGLPASERR